MSDTSYNLFTESFYSLWLGCLPEQIIRSAISEIESKHQAKSIKRRCHRLYGDYVVLETTLFLLTFFQTKAASEVEIGGETVYLRDLTDTGISSMVKKDSVNSSVSREYYEAKLPDGLSMEDFPHGRVKAELERIKDLCSPSVSMGGFGTGRGGTDCASAGYKKSFRGEPYGKERMGEGCFPKNVKAHR